MKRAFFTALLFTTLLTTATAQYFPVDTARLNKAYRTLEKDPQAKELQLDFFRAFPNNWEEFNSTYKYCSNKGYDLSMYKIAYKHIQALGNCTAINDTLFCNKLIALSVGATLDADAPSYLQGVLHYTMKKENDIFLHCLSNIDKGHQMQFWQFYWSSIIDGRSQQDEFIELYNKNKEKHSCVEVFKSGGHYLHYRGVLFFVLIV